VMIISTDEFFFPTSAWKTGFLTKPLCRAHES
jgi:hypothetical protein